MCLYRDFYILLAVSEYFRLFGSLFLESPETSSQPIFCILSDRSYEQLLAHEAR